MADRAGSVISIRYGTASSGSQITKIKVTFFQFDPEIEKVRTVVSGQIPAADGNPTLCKPFTVIESVGGVLSVRGFVDPSDAFIATLFESLSYEDQTESEASSAFEYDNVQWLLDTTESTSNHHGFNFGESPFDSYDPPMYWANGAIIPIRITGETDADGMQEVEFEIHSQLGVTYNHSL